MNARPDGVLNAERLFLAAAAGLDVRGSDPAADIDAVRGRLNDWLDRLTAEFDRPPLRWPGLQPDHALAAQAAELNAQLACDRRDWQRRRDDLGDTQAVARALDDQAVFLVFGKFNAGKSSLCNFIAERFAAHGRPVRYFRIEAGAVIGAAEGFQEGATETTTALQGVCLDETLVLLDTPGLHSVTPENAGLTRRFTDSADGVLWLTSSTSPGQVQELDELGRELRRAKPLLPVVTRSDYLEEDEIDGEIVKALRNKTPANRALQEADVLARGREKLARMGVEPALLMPPVSLSVYAARKQGQTPDAMAQAGFDAFWTAFAAIVGPALAYKRRKYAEIALHHRQEQVMHGLRSRQMPALDALCLALDAEAAALDDRRAAVVRSVWRAVAPELPELLEGHAGGLNMEAVCRRLSGLLADALRRACDTAWPGHALSVDPAALDIGLPDGAATALMDHERLHAALEASIRATLLGAADAVRRQGHAHLESLRAGADALRATLRRYRDELVQLEYELRSDAEAPAPASGDRLSRSESSVRG